MPKESSSLHQEGLQEQSDTAKKTESGLVVSGHHLKYVRQVLDLLPETSKNLAVEKVVKRVTDSLSLWDERFKGMDTYDGAIFSEDYFGIGNTEKVEYEAEFSAWLLRFFTSPDDAQVTVVLDELDDMCKMCRYKSSEERKIAGGLHCPVSYDHDLEQFTKLADTNVSGIRKIQLGLLKNLISD